MQSDVAPGAGTATPVSCNPAIPEGDAEEIAKPGQIMLDISLGKAQTTPIPKDEEERLP